MSTMAHAPQERAGSVVDAVGARASLYLGSGRDQRLGIRAATQFNVTGCYDPVTCRAMEVKADLRAASSGKKLWRLGGFQVGPLHSPSSHSHDNREEVPALIC